MLMDKPPRAGNKDKTDNDFEPISLLFWLLGVDSTETEHGFPTRTCNSSDFSQIPLSPEAIKQNHCLPCDLPLQFTI